MPGRLSSSFALFIVITALLFGAPDSRSQTLIRPAFASDEILVKLADLSINDAVKQLNRRHGASVAETFSDLGWMRLKLAPGTSIEDAVKTYARSVHVIAAQPNFYYYPQLIPNDPQFSHSGLYGLTKIAAPAAWDLTTGSSTVVVANIDTGMRLTHEDLAANIWVNPGEIPGNGVDDDGNGFVDDVNGWDFFFDDNDPSDENSHGTHVGGTIGAVGNNAIGIVGVNWNVKIMPIKIYNSTGSGTTSAMLINAYNYVRMMKLRGVNIRVTNNSYGGCDEACGYDQATKDAIDAMGDADILNVFAAGNSGTNNDGIPFFPASYDSPSILAVGGSDQDDNRRYNFGANSVDLAAPGSLIYSTVHTSNSSYGTKSGTSMSTPHAAGAAALLAAFDPSLSALSLKATLMKTVDQLPAFTGFNRSGGRLNVSRALNEPVVCTFQPNSAEIVVPTKGGWYEMSVTAPQFCDYSVRSGTKWVHITSESTESGSSTIKFRVGVNPTINRSAVIKIGSGTFTVSQKRSK
ncbi:MAG: S8 family serine peptidase [Acidobacteriota bacterium]|nr:MAG: S8 family serine peptidase [Acidobacteriota bacterium]